MSDLSNLVLFFTIYSFVGWTMETIYASKINKEFVNRGFLNGPFCPIYGFGAILVIQGSKLISTANLNYFTESIIIILFSIIITTIVEFITGYILEKIFNLKWWDYSGVAMNIKGYVCLKFSLLWGILAFVLMQIVHPIVANLVFFMPEKIKVYVPIILLYFFLDTMKSVSNILDLRKTIINHSSISIQKYYIKILKYERCFLAFPRLLMLNAGIINRDVRKILNDRIDKIKIEIKTRFQSL